MYPILLAAGAALSAAGTGLQMAGNAKSKREMNTSLLAERTRQAGYGKEAMQAFSANQQASTPQTAQADTEAGRLQREQAYQKIQAVPLATAQNSQPGVENTVQGRAQAASQQQQAQNQAAYMGMSEWQLRQMIRNIRAQQQLGLISTIARDSAGVNPYEIENASHAGDTLRGAGGLVSAAGSVAGSLGALGYGPAFGGGLSAVQGVDAVNPIYGSFV